MIDHEDVGRTPDGPRFEVAAIYTMRDGKIARVDFVKAALVAALGEREGNCPATGRAS